MDGPQRSEYPDDEGFKMWSAVRKRWLHSASKGGCIVPFISAGCTLGAPIKLLEEPKDNHDT